MLAPEQKSFADADIGAVDRIVGSNMGGRCFAGSSRDGLTGYFQTRFLGFDR